MQVYLLSKLLPGNRFYFAGDKKKIVYELDIDKPFEQVKQAGFWIKYANCRKTTELKLRDPERHKANRRVIFLR